MINFRFWSEFMWNGVIRLKENVVLNFKWFLMLGFGCRLGKFGGKMIFFKYMIICLFRLKRNEGFFLDYYL